MRLNKYIAQSTSLSRRKADEAIAAGRVTINGQLAEPGMVVGDADTVALDKARITPAVKRVTLILNKPVGYVVSRNGQGSPTVYDLLPAEYQHLNPVGRLDKDSSGLLLLTNDGDLAQELAHPSNQKEKVYEVTLDKPLTPEDKVKIEQGIQLEDGISKFLVHKPTANSQKLTAILHEGKNRQIRRTFAALNYKVITLHRIQFGNYILGTLRPGNIKAV